jgi:hypothetical protein
VQLQVQPCTTDSTGQTRTPSAIFVEINVTDHLAALRSAFDATHEPTKPEVGAATVAQARKAISEAAGQITILTKTASFSEAHAKALQNTSQSLRKAARDIEILEHGIREHVAAGFSTWRGAAGAETPVLL